MSVELEKTAAVDEIVDVDVSTVVDLLAVDPEFCIDVFVNSVVDSTSVIFDAKEDILVVEKLPCGAVVITILELGTLCIEFDIVIFDCEGVEVTRTLVLSDIVIFDKTGGRAHAPPSFFGAYSKIFNFDHWCPPVFFL